MIVDAWAQHPTLRHARDPIFDSLRRWNREEAPTEELPAAHQRRPQDAVRLQLPDDPAGKGARRPRRSQPLAGDPGAVPRRQRAAGLRHRRMSEERRVTFRIPDARRTSDIAPQPLSGPGEHVSGQKLDRAPARTGICDGAHSAPICRHESASRVQVCCQTRV